MRGALFRDRWDNEATSLREKIICAWLPFSGDFSLSIFGTVVQRIAVSHGVQTMLRVADRINEAVDSIFG